MATDKKISELDLAISLTATDLVPITDSNGENKSIHGQQIKDYVNEYYHAGDTVDVTRIGVSFNSGSETLRFLIPLSKRVANDVTTITIAGLWRAIGITLSNSTITAAILNDAELTTIGTPSCSATDLGIIVEVALNSGVISGRTIGNIIATSNNIITFS